MEHTLTYYSVSPAQVDGLKTALKGKIKHEGLPGADGKMWGGKLEGETALGLVKAEYFYTQGSGQLTVVIKQKPDLLTISTIDGHIRSSLNNIATEFEGASSQTPETPAPPATPEKKEASQKASDAAKS